MAIGIKKPYLILEISEEGLVDVLQVESTDGGAGYGVVTSCEYHVDNLNNCKIINH